MISQGKFKGPCFFFFQNPPLGPLAAERSCVEKSPGFEFDENRLANDRTTKRFAPLACRCHILRNTEFRRRSTYSKFEWCACLGRRGPVATGDVNVNERALTTCSRWPHIAAGGVAKGRCFIRSNTSPWSYLAKTIIFNRRKMHQIFTETSIHKIKHPSKKNLDYVPDCSYFLSYTFWHLHADKTPFTLTESETSRNDGFKKHDFLTEF